MNDSPPAEDRPLDADKLLRMANLARQVLDEARRMNPDEGTAEQLAALHGRVTNQLHQALPNVLVQELEEIDLDLPLQQGATGQEVRIAYAGLIGWLGGLFQGLQAAMQMAAAGQLQRGMPDRALAAGEEAPNPPEPPGRYL